MQLRCECIISLFYCCLANKSKMFSSSKVNSETCVKETEKEKVKLLRAGMKLDPMAGSPTNQWQSGNETNPWKFSNSNLNTTLAKALGIRKSCSISDSSIHVPRTVYTSLERLTLMYQPRQTLCLCS